MGIPIKRHDKMSNNKDLNIGQCLLDKLRTYSYWTKCEHTPIGQNANIQYTPIGQNANILL